MRSYSFAGVFNWGNSNGGSAVDMEIDGAGAGYVSEHLQFGREIFNATHMVIGPLGRRPSTCSSGASGRDIYVANDNPNAPVIYQCSATNTWTKHWEPYTYPHPLRGLSPPKE
jgi:hypothetical protein